MAIVSLKNIKKIYLKGALEVKALNGISLDIQKGEFHSFGRTFRIRKDYSFKYYRGYGQSHLWRGCGRRG